MYVKQKTPNHWVFLYRSALTLQVEWQEGHLAHKNPVVVPVTLSFLRAPARPGYPGSKGCKTVLF